MEFYSSKTFSQDGQGYYYLPTITRLPIHPPARYNLPTYLLTYYNLLATYPPTYLPTTTRSLPTHPSTSLPITTYLLTHLLINYYLPIYLSAHQPTY